MISLTIKNRREISNSLHEWNRSSRIERRPWCAATVWLFGGRDHYNLVCTHVTLESVVMRWRGVNRPPFHTGSLIDVLIESTGESLRCNARVTEIHNVSSSNGDDSASVLEVCARVIVHDPDEDQTWRRFLASVSLTNVAHAQESSSKPAKEEVD